MCSRAWLSALFNSVEAGWLGKRLANGCSGDFGWGSAIAPSYRFPHEGLPYHPSPERSPFFSHPRDTLPLLSPSTSTLSLPSPPSSPPPSPPFISTQRSVVQHSTEGVGAGGLQRFSLTHKRTHKYTHTHTYTNSLSAHVCVCACVRSICQNSFSSVIGLGVPVSMR